MISETPGANREQPNVEKILFLVSLVVPIFAFEMRTTIGIDLRWHEVGDSGAAVNEDEYTDDRHRDQHLGVEAEPRKVDGDLLTEIPPDQVERLELIPTVRAGPQLVQHSAFFVPTWFQRLIAFCATARPLLETKF